MERLQELWIRYRLHLIGVAIAVSVGAGLILKPAQPAPVSLASQNTPEPAGEIVVDVEGAVAGPGVRQLPAGSLVEDALAAAGGLTSAADVERVAKELNRADKLKDHQKLYVPAQQEASAATTQGSGSSGDEAGIVNINTASETELDKLPGVGPATAKKILDYREQNGGFESIDQLKDVPGIGDSKFEQLKDQITV
jgi:competence protein ComEA